jgi:predicted DNA-binding transcriptional regulator YafY
VDDLRLGSATADVACALVELLHALPGQLHGQFGVCESVHHADTVTAIPVKISPDLYNPTTRLLTVLELLQAHGRIGGSELAERLEVDERSVRRYVTMLQDLGIPITSERGRYGGYRLQRGFKLPPLMFTEDEALAVTLGLLTGRRFGAVGAAAAFEGALAKLDRVLPETVRQELRAVQETVAIDIPFGSVAPPAAESVICFSLAARGRRRLKIRYRSGGRDTVREVDPYGIVFRSGRWYAVGWCHLRTDVRVFRLDRVEDAELTQDTFSPPDAFDVREHLYRSLATAYTDWTVEVLLKAPIEDARRWISPIVGTLEETPQGVVLQSRVDSLAWMAHYLMGLNWPVVVLQPPELLRALRSLRAKITATLRDSDASEAPPALRAV